MAIDTSFLEEHRELVSCDECGSRFRILTTGETPTAFGTACAIEHYSRTGEKCNIEFYCSPECREVNAPDGIQIAEE